MYDLDRFLKAQAMSYETALAEMRGGRKESHWIWYIFPQILGLGRSSTAVYYSIVDRGEAEAYMKHPVLKAHLLEISEALLDIESDDSVRVMGIPDDMKLQSSMTLFATVAPEHEVFQKVLDKFYQGEMDSRTLRILRRQEEG